jgi:hypothetical protein
MEGALEWLRDSNISTGDLDDATVFLFRSPGLKFAGFQIGSRECLHRETKIVFLEMFPTGCGTGREIQKVSTMENPRPLLSRGTRHANARIQAFR